MTIPKTPARQIAAALVLLTSLTAQASDDLTIACVSELADKPVCECATNKLDSFLGKENFDKYQAFFAIFTVRHAQQIERDGDSLSAWNGAMSRYAKQAGEEPFDVMGWVPEFESVHRYALTACGAVVPDEGLEQSLLFFGEAR